MWEVHSVKQDLLRFREHSEQEKIIPLCFYKETLNPLNTSTASTKQPTQSLQRPGLDATHVVGLNAQRLGNLLAGHTGIAF